MVEAAERIGRFPQLAKYELLEELGHGGMATVYRARDRRLEREVAVKVIHPHMRNSAEVSARFHVEAMAVAKLRHPNIVEIYDVSDADEPEQYLVAELVRGTTLGRLRQARGHLPPEIAGAIALEILEALAHAHASGVIHRDVKPENVLIEHRRLSESIAGGSVGSGPRVAVKLTDFGIAKVLDTEGVTVTGQVLGSPAHMAPEQIEGGTVDGRADVFGLGVVLYECVVGHLPFQGSNPAQVLRRVLECDYAPPQQERPAVGARWSALIERALSRSPDDRFQTATQMREAIVAELSRVGFGESLSELTAWFDDPPSYEARHSAAVVDRLRALGDEERGRREVIAASWDYNRALALAPDDARLLQCVARMRRSEARARTLRRAGVSATALLLLGALVGAVSWAGRAMYRASPTVVGGPSLPQAKEAPPAGPDSASIGVAPSTQAAPAPRSSAPPQTLALRPREPAQGRVTERVVTLDLKPPMGVSLAIDGKPARAVSVGDTLTLDSAAHLLVFSCPVCSPVERALAAGIAPETVRVEVPILPATLVVEGNAAQHYQIAQRPDLHVVVGRNAVPLRSAYELVTVEQIETGTQRFLRLEAGRPVSATFE